MTAQTDLSVPELLYSLRYHILLLLLTSFVWQQYNSYRRLAKFNGPLLAKLSSLWIANSVSKRRTHLDLYEVSQKYGELARVGPNTLLTSDPELLIRMSSARSGYTRSDWYAAQKIEADNHNMFSITDEAIHNKRRSQMAIGYSGREIEGLEESVNKYVTHFINLIRRKYISTSSKIRPMDFARKTSFFTMDVTTHIAFGNPWECLTRDEDVNGYFESTDSIMPTIIMVSSVPWIAKLFQIPVIGKLVMPSDKNQTGAGKLLGIAKEVVRKRFDLEDRGENRDMMGSFIRHGITRKEAIAEATLQIVAGVDTTATTIRSTMLFTITNAPIYRTLQAEIDCTPCDGIITDSLARKLPYLQATIKEGARMWPPASGMLSKKTPSEGDTINGIYVPGGVDIGQCVWGVQRNKKVYGDDSEIFRPERWLEAKGKKLERMERSLGLVWGYGKYSCLGKNIAFLELNKIFFELLKNFDFSVTDPTNPWNSQNFGLWSQKEMWVRVTEREKE